MREYDYPEEQRHAIEKAIEAHARRLTNPNDPNSPTFLQFVESLQDSGLEPLRDTVTVFRHQKEYFLPLPVGEVAARLVLVNGKSTIKKAATFYNRLCTEAGDAYESQDLDRFERALNDQREFGELIFRRTSPNSLTQE